jgi:hypothetical protein
VTISANRAGLAANLATITGLRTSALIPDAPTPPQAVVIPVGVTFDKAMHRGLDEYRFTISLVGSRADTRSGQTIMDAFCNPTGIGSVKTAIESDRTLGGAAQTLHVTDVASFGASQIGDTLYLVADFSVTVYA